MFPFEQTIAMQGQQALLPSPTQDPNEIATRQGAFMPFIDNIKQSLTTPQGQMAALMIAQQMLAARAPGEANGALPRLVDGALQGMGAIAQFNANQQTQSNKEQEMAQQGEQLDVQRRGQDVSARGQDLQAQQSTAEIAAGNERAQMTDATQRLGIEERAKADKADASVRQAGVDAQIEANRFEAQDRQERMALEERQILATSEAARLKYGLDKDEGTTKLITEATKAAIEATGMGQGSFDMNFRNIYNNMATASGKPGIPGAMPSPQNIAAGVAAAKKAREHGIDPNLVIEQAAQDADRKFGVDAKIYAEEMRKALAAEPTVAPAAAAPAAPAASGGGFSLFDTTPAAPAAQIPSDQEAQQIMQQLAADDNIKKEASGSLGRVITTRTMPLGIAERRALENRLHQLQNPGKK